MENGEGGDVLYNAAYFYTFETSPLGMNKFSIYITYLYNKSFIGKALSCAGSSLCSDKYGPESVLDLEDLRGLCCGLFTTGKPNFC